MDKLKISGGKKLEGTIEISGSKNAALPILISSILADSPCYFQNVPRLHDIDTTLHLLQSLGATFERSKNAVRISAMDLRETVAPYDIVRKMRASILVLGPLLAKYGKATVSLPGGCAIGTRPVGFHIEGLERMGAKIALDQGYIIASCDRLVGTSIALDFPSVGATENLMMAACLAQGETVLSNCAQEPEIVDLAEALKKMGALIQGAGTDRIHIVGQKQLKGCTHTILADRIEAGTYLCAGLITGGTVRTVNLAPSLLDAVLTKLSETGAIVHRGTDWIEVTANGIPKPVEITTAPFPGFPTDMQAQLMAYLCTAQGISKITEAIFENRFMHVQELLRLGADIRTKGHTASVHGPVSLTGAPVMATDLRASASLIIAGLAAQGDTTIHRIYHLDRGYERLVEKLTALGAQVQRLA